MLQHLLSEIVETAVTATVHAISKFLRWEQAAEFIGAVIGLSLIVLGCTMALTGHHS
jgi:hypothetical protein